MGSFVRDAVKPIFNRLLRSYVHAVRPTFKLGGETYEYFLNEYNMTWRNERCVEVPVAWREIEAAKSKGKRILELGNVLSHYFKIDHDVVDKYEQAPSVANVDIVDFTPSQPYDLIVSISTLEHVGWDETPREPEKLLRAYDHLVSRCLAPGGRLQLTFPPGYNTALDAAIDSGRMAFTKASFLTRAAKFSQWEESTWPAIKGARYHDPYPFANGLIIGIVDKPAAS